MSTYYLSFEPSGCFYELTDPFDASFVILFEPRSQSCDASFELHPREVVQRLSSVGSRHQRPTGRVDSFVRRRQSGGVDVPQHDLDTSAQQTMLSVVDLFRCRYR